MAYIGRGVDKISNIEVLDAITFTNSAGPYNLLKDTVAFTPTSPNALVISIDGVVQSPDSYTIASATITFDTSMSSASTNDFIYQMGVGILTSPSDASVTAAKLSTSGTASSSTFLRGDMAWSTVTVGEVTTINTFFSNWNNIDSSITTTLVTTKNQFLCGPITVADTYTWDVAGTGTLTIL